MSNDKKRYTLVVKKQRIEVSKEVYRAYYESKEREAYIERLNRHYSVSLEDLQEQGVCIEYEAFNELPMSVEEEVINKILIAQIIESLNLDEQFLIKKIFMEGISERELAKKLKIHRKNLYSKKKSILQKVKKIIENEKK